MKRMVIVLSVVFFAAVANAKSWLVVDAEWLKQHLHDEDLVLLHIGDREEYEKSHIPGARYVSLKDIAVSDHSPTGLVLEMPPTAQDLHDRLEALGISDNSRVIAYYGNDWISPTTRVIFTLDYAGHGNRVSLLDGGMQEWIRRGGTVTAEATPPGNGKLRPLKLRPLIVDAAFVKSHLSTPGFRVIDGRASVFFDGIETGSHPDHPDRTGHIAGAGSIPFTSITDDAGVLLAPDALRALFDKAGVKKGDTVIGYCHIGQQTTAMLFAERLLGHDVLLYDGSFQDWSRHADYPVENPSAKAEQ
jgi:thiosulfate/3-mercaptopyruvate sulfurtransferase